MKVERILFPTDFSEGAAHALRYAMDLTKHYNAKLHILHVVYDFASIAGSHIPHISTDEFSREINKWAMDKIEKCCLEEIKDIPDVEKTVVEGIPYEEIIKFAEKDKSDVIVIGTHGRSGLEKFIFGSTAERVVRKAPCAVMSVRIPEHRA